MIVYKIRPDGGNPCVEKDLGAIMEWLKESYPGGSFMLSVHEMTEQEYEDLPEYMGP
uniref:Uncharacterized protein n=1 Tax=viral metagenome TaxID=1070528 RepID=A0A6M3INW6_9ZZZZ